MQLFACQKCYESISELYKKVLKETVKPVSKKRLKLRLRLRRNQLLRHHLRYQLRRNQLITPNVPIPQENIYVNVIQERDQIEAIESYSRINIRKSFSFLHDKDAAKIFLSSIKRF